MTKPRCETCIHFVEDPGLETVINGEPKNMGFCEFSAPEWTKRRPGDTDTTFRPIVSPIEGCSHHQNFMRYRVWFASERQAIMNNAVSNLVNDDHQ